MSQDAAQQRRTGWTQRPAAYLAFGDTYADEETRARGLGWPVERLLTA